MRKRVLTAILAVLMIMSLCSCGGGQGGSDSGQGTAGSKASFTPQTHRICAGASACAVLKDDGTVVCSLDTSEDQNIDVHDEWKSWTDVVDISMPEEILAAVKSDGTVVWCGGRTKEYEWLNDKDTMGVIDSWSDVVQVSAGPFDIAALKSDGSVEITGSIWTEDLEEKSGFTQVSVYDAILCLREDGTVFCFAPTTYEGQTWEYDVSGWSDITSVSAGFDHAVGLKKDGTVVATGNNEYGQCEVQEWTDIVQVCAGRDQTIGLKKDGTIVYCGDCDDTTLAPEICSWTDIVEISGFFDHFMGLKSDGTIEYTALPERANPTVNSIK